MSESKSTQPLGWRKLALPGVALSAIVAAACANQFATDEEIAEAEQAATAVTATFQNGVSPTTSYAGTDDATLRQAASTTNYGSATTCEIDGDDGSGVDKSCLVKWTLAGIPAGSTVQSATVTFRVTDKSASGYGIFDVSRSWAESQVTWNNAASGSAWATAGALGATDRGAQVGTATGTATGSITVTLNAAGISTVQRWVDGGQNAGLIIASATNTDGLDLASSEHATTSYRPKLSITYLPSGSGGSGGSTGAGGSSSTGGSASTGGASTGGASTGGASTGGASTGGAASGGTSGTATDANLLVAFIGDQGANGNSDAVLNLIKNEGASAVVHNGDFDYASNPTTWENRINGILGANYPYFATIGNHDAPAWNGSGGYGQKIAARIARVPEMQCTGTAGIQANCSFRGLHIVQSCVGTSEYTSVSCTKDSTTQVNFISNSLSSSNAIWDICSWHKNQNDMQLGTKGDEAGWNAYKACQAAGAIVSTGHEHSYGRTLAMNNIGTVSAGHGKNGAFDTVNLGFGQTFVFVSGLAGVGIRAFDTASHNDDTWWASQYASNRWMKSGAIQSGTGTYGALFIRFNVDGNPKKASAYFKDVNGRIVDNFVIYAP